ncbi:MAG: hypothetical protein K6F39_03540 [Lachnospiraceae bacterium]|nr:hypothetical protein [Lachnospiraceae bacterium]
MTNAYDLLNNRLYFVKKEITQISKELLDYPKGDIICTRSNKYSKWYKKTSKGLVYIPKKEINEAKILARKKYLRLRKEFLQGEERAISLYLRHHPKDRSLRLLSTEKGYRELLKDDFLPDDEKIIDWVNKEYETNRSHPENLRYRAHSGHLVRSKSEYMIATSLYIKKIPFRYECKLELNEGIFYPDFTLLNVSTGKEVYWEHFGMIDDDLYLDKFIQKLKIFSANGIYPGVNLIMTFETREHPLTQETIDETIRSFQKL